MATPDERGRRTWRFRLNDTSTLEVSTPPRATEKQVRRRGRFGLILGTAVAAVTFVTVGLATDLKTDLTFASNGIQQNHDLGNVVGGNTYTFTTNMFLQGADPGTTVTFADDATLRAPFATNVTGGSIDGTGTGNAETSTVTVKAPCTTGAFGGGPSGSRLAGSSIQYTATPSSIVTTTAWINIKGNVTSLGSNCAPPPSDTTAPTISCTVPDQTIWHANEVTVPCTASDASGLANPADASFSLTTNVGAGNESASSQTNSRQVCDTVSPTPNCATAGPYTFMVDRKAPAISCGSADALWHASDVSIACTTSDLGSGLANAADASFNLTTNVPAGNETNNASTNSRNVADNVGNSATAGPISGNMVDKKGPVVTLTCASDVILGSSASAGWTASDGGSGVASGFASGTISGLDTSSVGLKTATAPAGTSKDNVDNSSPSTTCQYNVIFDWNGFFSPVENLPAGNVAKAGSAIPVKFSLAGDQGLGIFAAGYPKVVAINCAGLGTDLDPLEEVYPLATANSKLIYDATVDQYNYVWKTDKTWAGKCFRLELKLIDGKTYSANFKFTK